MDDEPREVELKFLYPPSRAREILGHLFPRGHPGSRTLTSVYFDSDGHDLRRAGFTLRLRLDQGGWTQTVKTMAGSGGRLGRGEWESPALGEVPDRDQIRATPAGAALTDRALSPIFQVILQRRSVLARAAGATVEISLDRGRVIAANRATRVEELELELKSGPASGLFAIAKVLQRRFDLEPSFATKADRGFTLVDRRASRVRRHSAPALTDEVAVGQAFWAIAVAALEQIAANAALVRGRPSAEAIHQTRVGARRLRSALATFAPVLTDDRAPGVVAELKWFAGELDPARNLDVLLAGAWRRAARRKTAKTAFVSLGVRLRTDRAAAHARARAACGSPRFHAMVLDILSWIEDGPWTAPDAPGADERDAPLRPFAARLLEKAGRKVRKRGRRFGGLDRGERHAVRIAAKRLRYAAEVLAPNFAHRRRAKRFLDRLKALLENLGELNDIATGEAIVGDGPAADTLISAERARERRLIAAAGDAFARFAHSRPPWPEET